MRDRSVEQLFLVAALPLYHIFALTACAMIGVRNGGVSLLIPNPRDIRRTDPELRNTGEHFPAVNTLFNALLNHPDFAKSNWSNLKCVGRRRHGGTAARWREPGSRRPARPIIEGYGLSETSPVLTCNRADIVEWTGTIGLPLPSTEICDPRRQRQGRALWRARRDLRARAAGHGRATGSGRRRPRRS